MSTPFTDAAEALAKLLDESLPRKNIPDFTTPPNQKSLIITDVNPNIRSKTPLNKCLLGTLVRANNNPESLIFGDDGSQWVNIYYKAEYHFVIKFWNTDVYKGINDYKTPIDIAINNLQKTLTLQPDETLKKHTFASLIQGWEDKSIDRTVINDQTFWIRPPIKPLSDIIDKLVIALDDAYSRFNISPFNPVSGQHSLHLIDLQDNFTNINSCWLGTIVRAKQTPQPYVFGDTKQDDWSSLQSDPHASAALNYWNYEVGGAINTYKQSVDVILKEIEDNIVFDPYEEFNSHTFEYLIQGWETQDITKTILNDKSYWTKAKLDELDLFIQRVSAIYPDNITVDIPEFHPTSGENGISILQVDNTLVDVNLCKSPISLARAVFTMQFDGSYPYIPDYIPGATEYSAASNFIKYDITPWINHYIEKYRFLLGSYKGDLDIRDYSVNPVRINYNTGDYPSPFYFEELLRTGAIKGTQLRERDFWIINTPRKEHVVNKPISTFVTKSTISTLDIANDTLTILGKHPINREKYEESSDIYIRTIKEFLNTSLSNVLTELMPTYFTKEVKLSAAVQDDNEPTVMQSPKRTRFFLPEDFIMLVDSTDSTMIVKEKNCIISVLGLEEIVIRYLYLPKEGALAPEGFRTMVAYDLAIKILENTMESQSRIAEFKETYRNEKINFKKRDSNRSIVNTNRIFESDRMNRLRNRRRGFY